MMPVKCFFQLYKRSPLPGLLLSDRPDLLTLIAIQLRAETQGVQVFSVIIKLSVCFDGCLPSRCSSSHFYSLWESSYLATSAVQV